MKKLTTLLLFLTASVLCFGQGKVIPQGTSGTTMQYSDRKVFKAATATTPTNLTSMIWDGWTQGTFKRFTFSNDSTLTVIDSVPGTEMDLRILRYGATTDSNVFKVKINTDSFCYNIDSASAVYYIAYFNPGPGSTVVDQLAIPARWRKMDCPTPSLTPILLNVGYPSGYTGASGNGPIGGERLQTGAGGSTYITVSGTHTITQIKFKVSSTIGVTRAWAQKWTRVSGTNFGSRQLIVDSTASTTYFGWNGSSLIPGEIILNAQNAVTVSPNDVISFGFTGVSTNTIQVVFENTACYITSGSSPETTNPLDWSTQTSTIGYYVPIEVWGNKSYLLLLFIFFTPRRKRK